MIPQQVTAQRSEQQEATPITIFLIDGLSVASLKQWMNKHQAFYHWVKRSDLGVMTMRTAGNRSVQNQLLTLSTGVKSAGPVELLQATQYEKHGMIHIPYYEAWQREQGFHSRVTLGEALQRAGHSIEVIGNGDIGLKNRRLAPLLATDMNGTILKGDIEDLLVHESLLDPLFYVSDYEQIKLHMLHSNADLLVVELGDLRRLFSAGKRIPAAERQWLQTEIEDQVIQLLLWSSQQFGGTREIWVLGPGVDPIAEQGLEWMTPLIRQHVGQHKEAIFTSPTTRQAGIVANVDLMPTMLDHWGLEIPIGLEGRILDRMEGKGTQAGLLARAAEIFYVHKTRPDLLYQVISLQVLLLLSIGLLSMFVRRNSVFILKVGHYVLIYVLMVPLLLLLLGAFVPRWEVWVLHMYLFIGGLVFGYLFRNTQRREIYSWISIFYISTLLVDGLLNNMMMKRSFLGYDPVIGARYYGIGNEYMGVLIGSGLLLFYLLYQRIQNWNRIISGGFLLAFMLLILYYLAMPNGGTNAGGTIAWMVALLFASQVLFPELWVKKRIGFVLGGAALLFTVFLLIQFLQPGAEQTHIGRLLHQMSADGTGSFIDTIKRKWEMNLRLIKVSTWSKLFVTSLVLLAWFLLLPRRRRRKEVKADFWRRAFRAIVWVSLVNLLVNDSGVVAAALSLLFAAVPLLHLVLYERSRPLPTTL